MFLAIFSLIIRSKPGGLMEEWIFDIHGFVHRDTIYENDQEDATV